MIPGLHWFRAHRLVSSAVASRVSNKPACSSSSRFIPAATFTPYKRPTTLPHHSSLVQVAAFSYSPKMLENAMDETTLKQYLADDPPTCAPLAIKPHFEALNQQEKHYAHYISRAAFAGTRINLRQVSPESESIYDFILALHSAGKGKQCSLLMKACLTYHSTRRLEEDTESGWDLRRRPAALPELRGSISWKYWSVYVSTSPLNIAARLTATRQLQELRRLQVHPASPSSQRCRTCQSLAAGREDLERHPRRCLRHQLRCQTASWLPGARCGQHVLPRLPQHYHRRDHLCFRLLERQGPPP